MSYWHVFIFNFRRKILYLWWWGTHCSLNILAQADGGCWKDCKECWRRISALTCAISSLLSQCPCAMASSTTCSQLPGDAHSSGIKEDQGTGVQREGVGTRCMGNVQALDRNSELWSAGSMLEHLSVSKRLLVLPFPWELQYLSSFAKYAWPRSRDAENHLWANWSGHILASSISHVSQIWFKTNLLVKTNLSSSILLLYLHIKIHRQLLNGAVVRLVGMACGTADSWHCWVERVWGASDTCIPQITIPSEELWGTG